MYSRFPAQSETHHKFGSERCLLRSGGVAARRQRLLELPNSFFDLELLFYFHVEIPPKGIRSRGIEPIAFVGKWRIGIEDVVNTKG
jgi:hypothetical protein